MCQLGLVSKFSIKNTILWITDNMNKLFQTQSFWITNIQIRLNSGRNIIIFYSLRKIPNMQDQDSFHLLNLDEPDRTETCINRNDNMVPSSSKFLSESFPRSQLQPREQRGSDKWKNKQRMLYFKFYLKFFVKHPYLQLSWKRWKVNNIFSLMADYIKTKTKEQIKSFDERMKNYWFKKNKKDILECLELELKEYMDEDQQLVELFTELEDKKLNQSQHMTFLKKDNKLINDLSKQLQHIYNSWEFNDNI